MESSPNSFKAKVHLVTTFFSWIYLHILLIFFVIYHQVTNAWISLLAIAVVSAFMVNTVSAWRMASFQPQKKCPGCLTIGLHLFFLGPLYHYIKLLGDNWNKTYLASNAMYIHVLQVITQDLPICILLYLSAMEKVLHNSVVGIFLAFCLLIITNVSVILALPTGSVSSPEAVRGYFGKASIKFALITARIFATSEFIVTFRLWILCIITLHCATFAFITHRAWKSSDIPRRGRIHPDTSKGTVCLRVFFSFFATYFDSDVKIINYYAAYNSLNANRRIAFQVLSLAQNSFMFSLALLYNNFSLIRVIFIVTAVLCNICFAAISIMLIIRQEEEITESSCMQQPYIIKVNLWRQYAQYERGHVNLVYSNEDSNNNHSSAVKTIGVESNSSSLSSSDYFRDSLPLLRFQEGKRFLQPSVFQDHRHNQPEISEHQRQNVHTNQSWNSSAASRETSNILSEDVDADSTSGSRKLSCVSRSLSSCSATYCEICDYRTLSSTSSSTCSSLWQLDNDDMHVHSPKQELAPSTSWRENVDRWFTYMGYV